MTRAVAVVTGAGTGIGREIALALARSGCLVYGTLREPEGRNREKARDLQEQGGASLRLAELDVTCDVSAHACIDAILADAGRIDVLVNNAGIMFQGVTEAYTVDDARLQMETNFFGALRMNRLVLPSMRRQRGGLIVHVTSIAGSVVFPYASLYSASKMALEGVAEGYRHELAEFGVDSIVVQPCPYPSALLESQRHPGDTERLQEYGEQAHIARRRIAATRAWHSSGAAPDVAEVGSLVAALAALPFGQRPFRSVAGRMDFGARALNAAREQAQDQVLQAFRGA